MVILSVLVMVFVFEKDDLNPAYKIMWLIITVVLPITGAVMYILWGDGKLPPKTSEKFKRIEKSANEAMVTDRHLFEAFQEADPTLCRQAEYLNVSSAAPIYHQCETTYFKSGEDFYTTFLKELNNAKKSIFLEYFIIEPGKMWDEILEVLKEKAAAGVDVRVVFDGVGSMFTLPRDYEQELRKFGIKAHAFNKLELTLHISHYIVVNHRDHRKIAVIDSEVGFTGGINLADEYINEIERFGYWKDTAFMLKGSAVYSLSVTFFKIWEYVSGDKAAYEDFMPKLTYPEKGFVQPFSDTPLDDENVSESAYLNIINRAQHYVYITSPYLVIDYEMQSALALAAKSGVDVRIVVPGIPDKPYVYILTQSYYRQLIRAGVKIYEYTPGFIHAKMYVSDNCVAVIGSANMDFRSLYLHFENCCAFYGGEIIDKVRDDIKDAISKSREVMWDDVEKTHWFKRAVQLVIRFFAPLM